LFFAEQVSVKSGSIKFVDVGSLQPPRNRYFRERGRWLGRRMRSRSVRVFLKCLLSWAVLHVAVAPAAAIVPAGSEPAEAAVTSASNDAPAELAIPTRIDRIGRIIVPVTINGQGPFRFIVDTGASRSTVAPSVVSRLGLSQAAEAQIEVNGITGTAQVPAVSVASLRSGGVALDGNSFPVMWEPMMAGADGILGAAGLTRQVLSVDFDHNKVSLSDATGRGGPTGSTRIRARRLNGGLLAVPAHVGRISVTAVIDTGSERTLGNLALRDAMNVLPRPGMPMQVATVYGATTEVVQGETQVAPIISIEQLRIADVTLTLGDFHIFNVWQLRGAPALIIGMDILGTVGGITIDFKNQYVYFQGRGMLSTSSPDAFHAYSILHTGGRR
jgi:predicted aspartyl protease